MYYIIIMYYSSGKLFFWKLRACFVYFGDNEAPFSEVLSDTVSVKDCYYCCCCCCFSETSHSAVRIRLQSYRYIDFLRFSFVFDGGSRLCFLLRVSAPETDSTSDPRSFLPEIFPGHLGVCLWTLCRLVLLLCDRGRPRRSSGAISCWKRNSGRRSAIDVV